MAAEKENGVRSTPYKMCYPGPERLLPISPVHTGGEGEIEKALIWQAKACGYIKYQQKE